MKKIINRNLFIIFIFTFVLTMANTTLFATSGKGAVSITEKEIYSSVEYYPQRIQYPQISGLRDSKVQKSINEKIYMTAKKYYDKDSSNASARTAYINGDMKWYTYFTYIIGYNSNNLLSIRYEFESYTGGVRINHYYLTQTFNLIDGSILRLEDLMNSSSFKGVIDQTINSQAKSKGGTVPSYSNLREDDQAYYITSEGIVIICDPFTHFSTYKSFDDEAFLINYSIIDPYLKTSYNLSNNKLATPTKASVLVNGAPVDFQAYNICGSNYFKLRDIAQALNGTGNKFDISYDGSSNTITLISGKEYTSVSDGLSILGSAGMTASTSNITVYLNGDKIDLNAYNIGGSNYFKLRDIADATGFAVIWDDAARQIKIETTVDSGRLLYLAFAQFSYNDNFKDVTFGLNGFTFPKSSVRYPIDDECLNSSKDVNNKMWKVDNSPRWIDFYNKCNFKYWDIANPVSIDGFFAVSFINEDDREVVIAYRGTNDSTDYLTDANIATNNFDPSFVYAAYYYLNTIENYKGYNIVLTGHSLGGALASFVSMNYGVKAYTFSAPSITRALLRITGLVPIGDFDRVFRGMDAPYFTEISNYGDTAIAQLNEDWGKGNILDNTTLLNGDAGLVDINFDHHQVQALLKFSYNNDNYAFDFIPKKMTVSNNNTVILDPLNNNSIGAVYGTMKKDTITCNSLWKTTVYSGDGNDEITSGLLDDQLYGGKGDDTYYINSYAGTDTINDIQGNDKIVLSKGISKNSVILDSTSDDDYYIVKYKNGLLQGTINISKSNPVEKIQFGSDSNNYINIY